MTTTLLPTGANTREVTFPVTGMTGASRVRRIEKALTRVDGVQEASVTLATEKARVAYNPAAASFEALQAAVQKAGYGVAQQAPVDAPPSLGPTMLERSPSVPLDIATDGLSIEL